MGHEQIPLVDLGAQLKNIRSEIDGAITAVLDSQDFIKGRFVAAFERDFVSLHGAAHGVGCSNGTSAISAALAALEVGVGDEVITTPLTFIATVEAIYHVGAKPVFVDIDSATFQLDVKALEAAITPRTRAIIPVHLYGNPCDMPAIQKIAERRGLKVVEDCAQAHFAKIANRYVGTYGDAATFSFYPGKNLGAFGDAGFVFTREAAIAEFIRKLVDHGRLGKYDHDIIGFNNRMAGIQAAVLSVKLKHILSWTASRRQIAARYDDSMKRAGFRTLTVTPGAECVYHLYPVLVANRDSVMARLKDQGIATGIHYPTPLHLQPALKDLGHHPGDFSRAEYVSGHVLSLPIFRSSRPLSKPAW